MAKGSRQGQWQLNWKPWQTSPWYLTPLIIISLLIAAILEYLVQTSNKSMTSRHLLSEWATWFTNSSSTSSFSDIQFNQSPDPCKQGILTFTKTSQIATGSYILWIYIPSIFFVVFALLWEIVDNEAKRIEPFYQTSRPNGAIAGRSIFAEYIDLPSFLSPLQAIYWRHWVIVLCALNVVLMGTITPILQSQMFQTQAQMLQVGYKNNINTFVPLTRGQTHFPLSMTGVCGNDPETLSLYLSEHSTENDPDTIASALLQYVVYLDPVMTRVQEAILLAVAVAGSVFLWCCWTRPSGMKDSLHGFAVTSSLCSVDGNLLDSFRRASTAEDWEQSIKTKRIRLGYQTTSESQLYGLWLTDEPTQTTPSPPPNPILRFLSAIKDYLASAELLKTFHGPIQHLKWTFRLSILAFLFLGIYSFIYGTIDKPTTQSEAEFHNEPGSDPAKLGGGILQSAPNLIISAFAKSIWKLAEKKVASYWIFRSAHLEERKAWPVLARDYASLPVGFVTIRALLDGQYMLALITFFSLLLEIAHICFGITASMGQGAGWTVNGVLANSWIAAGVLLLICVPGPVWWKILFGGRNLPLFFPDLKEDPGSFGMQMAYACRSEEFLMETRPLVGLEESMRREYLEGFHYEFCDRNIVRA